MAACLIAGVAWSATHALRPNPLTPAHVARAASPTPPAVARTSGETPMSPTVTPAEPSWQTFQVGTGDTLSKLFARAGLNASECSRVMALGPAVKTLRLLHPGEQLRLRTDPESRLSSLRYSEDPLETLVVATDPKGLEAHVEHLHPVIERTRVEGVVQETLSAALQQAGVSTSLAAEFVKIFRWRVDFRRQIHPGTRFALVYDKRHVGTRDLDPGPILAAELALPDQTLHAFRFSGSDNDSGYYDRTGKSVHPTLLRTPVHYTRISSPFSRHRFDPVVHVWRPHFGVDLAAAFGTPVLAAGEGRIIFIGRDGGYGNLVKIRNFGPYSTRYAHLRRFARGLHMGSHVRQGQIIGYVGDTGEATGPHLHFEIRVNGVPHNPLTVKLPAGRPLGPKDRLRFEIAIRPLVAMLENPDAAPPQLAHAGRTLAADLSSAVGGTAFHAF